MIGGKDWKFSMKILILYVDSIVIVMLLLQVYIICSSFKKIEYNINKRAIIIINRYILQFPKENSIFQIKIYFFKYKRLNKNR